MQSDSQFTLGTPSFFIALLYASATSYLNAQLAKAGIRQGDFNLPSNIAVPLAESSSIVDNFPLIFIFIYRLATFIREIPDNPIYLTGFSAIMAAVPGYLFGYDGAETISNEEAIRIFAALLLTLNTFCTRFSSTAKFMKLMKEMMELLRKRGDKISFNKEVLLNLLENYPSYTINILKDAEDALGTLSDASLKLIIEQVTATKRTPSQVIHALWNRVRGALSFLLTLGGLSVVPFWRDSARRGWNRIHPGLGDRWYLREPAAIPHILYYLEQSSQFLSRTFDGLFIPMMSAFYNPKQGGCRNFIRMLSIPATLFFIMRMIDWWSGLSMSFEAEGIDLNDEMGGILAFLNNFYPKMLQLYAGSILNGCAVATFCRSVLPSIKPVNNFFNWVLRVTGATETPRSEAENAETDRQQLLEDHVNSEVGPELQTAVRKSKAMDRVKKRFEDQPEVTATLVETSLGKANHTPRLSFFGMFTLKPTYPGVQGSAENHRYGCMDRVYRVLGW